jgi:hypothetical protein
MFTLGNLAALRRSLHDEQVLSVYVSRSTSGYDQHPWFRQLERRFAVLHDELRNAPVAERQQFERCVEHARTALAAGELVDESSASVRFITADGVRDSSALAVDVPTSAMWSVGPWLAPCLRSMKELRPVIVVIADGHRASIFEYRDRAIHHLESFTSALTVENPPLHMGTPPRRGFHPGTRGTAGHDVAERGALESRDEMIHEAATRVMQLAGSEGWVLLGGIKRADARFFERIAAQAPDRVLELESLDVHSSTDEIAEAARQGASTLRDDADRKRIDEIFDALGHGLGVVGVEDTRDALDQKCVRHLYVSPRYLEDHASDANTAVGLALDQDAQVEEVSNHAANVLDMHGGIAASLRFRPAALDHFATL